jgi:hypothetical protein
MADEGKASAKPQIHLSLPLDEKKIAAIHECLKKGKLEITIGSVDTLKAGEHAVSGYLYD